MNQNPVALSLDVIEFFWRKGVDRQKQNNVALAKENACLTELKPRACAYFSEAVALE